jgi:hypothetical protein
MSGSVAAARWASVGLLGVFVGALIGVGCGDRLANDDEEWEALKRDACERDCETLETCNVDLSWTYEYWPEPQGCVDRCMTLRPLLHEDNQCGSREIIGLRCIGDLDCEGYEAYRAGFATPTTPPDFSAPCITETIQGCSIYKPFDLDEVITAPESFP